MQRSLPDDDGEPIQNTKTKTNQTQRTLAVGGTHSQGVVEEGHVFMPPQGGDDEIPQEKHPTQTPNKRTLTLGGKGGRRSPLGGQLAEEGFVT